MLVAYPRFQIPLNPPFLKGEISHNDLDGTTIKAAKIYKTGGLKIKDTLRNCQQENERCLKCYAVVSLEFERIWWEEMTDQKRAIGGKTAQIQQRYVWEPLQV